MPYKCDTCGKPAKYNVCSVNKSYEITKDDDFNELNEWDGDESDFYCAKHAKEEGIAD